MPWSIFGETIRRSWRGTLLWGLGLGFLGWVVISIIPNVVFLKQIMALLDTMPAIIKALGMDDATQMASPEGFVSAGYYGRVILIMAVYAVLAGLNVSANEEDAGIMDVVLSLPVARWRIIIERFTAYGLMSIVIVLMGFVGLYMGGVTSAVQVDVGKLLIGSINVLPSLLLMLAFTAFAGAVFRRKAQATVVAASFIIASYVVDFAGSAASESPIAVLRALSFFAYYDNAHIMQSGLNAANSALLLGLTVLLVGASVWGFQRRDIGV